MLHHGMTQSQKLNVTMAAALRHHLQLLQFSGIELKEYIESELERNPMLEADSWAASSYDGGVRTGGAVDLLIHTIADQRQTLTDHLLEQARFLNLAEPVDRAVRELIMHVDNSGYLRTDLDEIAESLGIPLELVLLALDSLQNLEPAGVGARSVRECLLLQLARRPQRDRTDELAAILADKFLDEIAERSFSSIAKMLNVPVEEVTAAAKRLSQLNPRPGAAYDGEAPVYIVPDVYFVREGEQWVVRLNEALLPPLRIHADYEQMMRSGGLKEEDRQYMHACIRSARAVISGIQQRRTTLLAVASIIAEEQSMYLLGKGALMPLTLQNIADRLGLHKSTVSRAVRHKYAASPRGVAPLKSYCSRPIRTDDVRQVTGEAVKVRINQLVGQEDASTPLTDQRLVELLRAEGIAISRRTAAHYRGGLGIPTAAKRKMRWSHRK